MRAPDVTSLCCTPAGAPTEARGCGHSPAPLLFPCQLSIGWRYATCPVSVPLSRYQQPLELAVHSRQAVGFAGLQLKQENLAVARG